MSENERMERARRIREMREGQRDGEDDSPETTEDGATADAEADEGTPTPDDGSAELSATSTDGGATAASADPESDGSEPTDEAETDEIPADEMEAAAAEAVENVGGTRAELPSTEEMEAAMEQTMEQAQETTEEGSEAEDGAAEESDGEQAGPAGLAGEADQTTEADTRVLEFTLDDEQYCLDIQYIEEIVKHTAITRVPNTPAFIEGVVDLRGQITTILNPKETIGKPNKEAGDLIVVFDSDAFEDQGHIGWVVDDVRQVSPISDDQVNDPPMQKGYINGVIDRDDGEFVIWTKPDLALEEAE